MKPLISLLAAAAGLFAQAPPGGDGWKALAFLAGEWTAGNSAGQPGKASAGGFTFRYELDGKVLVRRSFAEYPAGEGKPAIRHEDLMIVYPGSPVKAVYWDSEGHVIQYRVAAVAGGVEFLSDPEERAPRYRLTYRTTGANTADLIFEIAPPGRPDSFQKYISASVVRTP